MARATATATGPTLIDKTPGTVPATIAALETAVPAAGQPATGERWEAIYGTPGDYQKATIIGGVWIPADQDPSFGTNRYHLTETAVAPATPGEPTDTELASAVTAAGLSDRLAFYTGTDSPTDNPVCWLDVSPVGVPKKLSTEPGAHVIDVDCMYQTDGFDTTRLSTDQLRNLNDATFTLNLAPGGEDITTSFIYVEMSDQRVGAAAPAMLTVSIDNGIDPAVTGTAVGPEPGAGSTLVAFELATAFPFLQDDPFTVTIVAADPAVHPDILVYGSTTNPAALQWATAPAGGPSILFIEVGAKTTVVHLTDGTVKAHDADTHTPVDVTAGIPSTWLDCDALPAGAVAAPADYTTPLPLPASVDYYVAGGAGDRYSRYYGFIDLDADRVVDLDNMQVGDVTRLDLRTNGHTFGFRHMRTIFTRGAYLDAPYVNHVTVERVTTDCVLVAVHSHIPGTLVFRQDITGQTNFMTAAEALNTPDADPATAAKYSILDQLETMRRADGQLEFELVYPAAGITAGPSTGHDIRIRWEQTDNPTSSPNQPAGFKVITQSERFDQFVGLAPSAGTTGTESWYDADDTGWWAPVGLKGWWTGAGGGMPARRDPNGQHDSATIVELYVHKIGA